MKRRLSFMLGLIISLASCKKEQSQLPNQASELSTAASKKLVNNGGGTLRGGGGGSTTCTTIQDFRAREGKKVGSTIIHTIEVSYSIKPCDATQNLVATIEVYNYNTGALEFQLANYSELSGKVLYAGASLGLHTVVLKSVDANTGAVIESQQTVIAVTVQTA